MKDNNIQEIDVLKNKISKYVNPIYIDKVVEYITFDKEFNLLIAYKILNCNSDELDELTKKLDSENKALSTEEINVIEVKKNLISKQNYELLNKIYNEDVSLKKETKRKIKRLLNRYKNSYNKDRINKFIYEKLLDVPSEGLYTCDNPYINTFITTRDFLIKKHINIFIYPILEVIDILDYYENNKDNETINIVSKEEIEVIRKEIDNFTKVILFSVTNDKMLNLIPQLLNELNFDRMNVIDKLEDKEIKVEDIIQKNENIINILEILREYRLFIFQWILLIIFMNTNFYKNLVGYGSIPQEQARLYSTLYLSIVVIISLIQLILNSVDKVKI